jgi:hypothetical protein
MKIGKFVQRNKIIKKIGIDTDNCFSWMEKEKLTRNYKPAISRRENLIHANYIVFGELMNLILQKNPNTKVKEVFSFLRRNHIYPIKKRDVDSIEVEKVFNNLKNERKKKNWTAGDNDLKIISVYYCAGIDCISTNNLKHFKEPCDYLKINIDFPPIIEPGTIPDVSRMLRDLYRNH